MLKTSVFSYLQHIYDFMKRMFYTLYDVERKIRKKHESLHNIWVKSPCNLPTFVIIAHCPRLALLPFLL